LTHLNSASAYNCDTGLRFGILLVALTTTTLLAVSAKVTAAQTAPPAETPAKTPDKPKDKDKAETSTTAKPNNTNAVAAVDEDAYRIGLDDQLMISVWREPELSLSVVVRPDGMITLPLLSDVHVVGLKPTELQDLLTEKLKPFVSEPQVTVIAQGIRSRKVYLVGNVSKQGTFNLEGGQTVLQLLASAGGVNPFAKGDSIYILRMENKKQIRIPFQYKKALKGRTKDDVRLQPGDIIVVP
jgi:polysaccharide biosynthesis/export protein